MHCENGMNRPSDIAFHLGIAPASVTYLLWKFIDKEYCTREIDESDVCVSYLKITEHEGSKILRSFLNTLTEEDGQQLFRIHEKLL